MSSKPHILFVEDDVGKRYVIARQLRAAGFEVDEAATGEEFLAKLRNTYDVAILDIKLPDTTGWDLCKRIKENPETSSIKVLELSGTLATAQDRAKGLDLGADAYLVHPVEMVELVAVLRALVRLRHAERDKQRALDLFLATLGHDLRHPLGNIETGLQLLSESELPHADHEIVVRLQRMLGRTKRMLDQLLAFTQSLADVVSVSRQLVDLADICRQIVKDTAHGVDRPIDVIAEPDVVVRADVDNLMRLVDNLLGNAIKHGEGPITIRIRRDGDAPVLAIHNGGPPIPQEALSRLFDPFTRATTTKGGFGLGLYIVGQIASTHDATITVDSTTERGTTFTVKFPPPPPRPAR